MALLVIRKAGEQDRVFRIRREQVVIGRDDSAHLVLPDIAVSRRHASIVVEAGRYSVVDQGSTNGLKVNDVRTERCELEHGDVVKIGSFRLEFNDERKVDLLQVTRLASLSSRTPKAKPDNMHTMCIQSEEVESPEPADQAVLRRKGGDGSRWRPGSRRLTIGPGGDVPIDLDLTSQPVAEIRWDGERHLIRAWSWAYRVEVDGKRVREAFLEPGSSIRVDDALFEFIHEAAVVEGDDDETVILPRGEE